MVCLGWMFVFVLIFFEVCFWFVGNHIFILVEYYLVSAGLKYVCDVGMDVFVDVIVVFFDDNYGFIFKIINILFYFFFWFDDFDC